MTRGSTRQLASQRWPISNAQGSAKVEWSPYHQGGHSHLTGTVGHLRSDRPGTSCRPKEATARSNTTWPPAVALPSEITLLGRPLAFYAARRLEARSLRRSASVVPGPVPFIDASAVASLRQSVDTAQPAHITPCFIHLAPLLKEHVGALAPTGRTAHPPAVSGCSSMSP
jgi:hypothetical protein